MGQPVKLSDDLILNARLSAGTSERSIAGQIEFWAGLGRAIEPLLRSGEAEGLKQGGAPKPLSECMAEIGTPKGARRLAAVLNERPYPHYEAAPGRPGFIVRIDADGTRTTGRFRNRRFVRA
jgi:hypothetical protein